MAGEGDYFGYTPSQNEDLMENRRMARRMGEDISHYPPPQGDDQYIDPTPNFEKQFGDSLKPGDETRAYYANGIEDIYKRIMSQDPVVLHRLADQWWQLHDVLQDLRSRVLNAAKNLKEGGDGEGGKGGWTGAGADAFLARGPGATLKSIDDWEQAAFNNWMGTLALASAMSQRRGEMERLYQQYKDSMVSMSSMWLDNPQNADIDGKKYSSINAIPKGSYQADNYITWMRNAQLGWHYKAQKIQYDMAQDYWRTMSEDYAGGRATVYEGPGDAVLPNPEFIARYGMPNFGPPPKIQTPTNINPNITALNDKKPDVSGLKDKLGNVDPDIKAPTTDDITKPDIDTPTATPPSITTPTVTPPVGQLPVVPPVVPPGLPPGGPGKLPALGPGGLPTAPATSGLLKNLGGAGPGVLRAGMTPPSPEGGLPPGMPQRGTQAPPPPTIKGRGPGSGTPHPPQGKRGTDGPEQAKPGTPGTPGVSDQFGGPPGTPASPVLRNPHANPPAPSRGGGNPRRGTPGVSGGQNPGGSGPPLHPGATTPPVLSRPQQRSPQAEPPARPGTAPPVPNAPLNPLAPPPRPTASPVVGRSARLDPGAPPPPEPTAGVMRGKRNDGIAGYEGEIGSRKRSAQEPQVSVDDEFDNIRRILDREGAWTVDTPGGGVLDSGPARSAAPSAEPKPTLGA
ncbi:hypothetical protein [Phytohabitans rumicis]|uniref:Uncharacterized protein n=1 Tax=Phytohabitans rumicis TaxID=1076125 RepID=A0A6V8L3U7_9ACTN|nr:hypothetical protein [Phytohabitans rumicis]GFJ88747.1 hypothetical protein Prum_023890 [Phytohabitans rumicis]